LYGEYTLFSTFEEKMKNDKKHSFVAIIGQNPDLISPRNFVSLDTRSREVRNRGEGKSQFLNMVIRPYASSVGQEYFISWEDELGYIYGFTRLLLPNS